MYNKFVLAIVFFVIDLCTYDINIKDQSFRKTVGPSALTGKKSEGPIKIYVLTARRSGKKLRFYKNLTFNMINKINKERRRSMNASPT
jgi:hypothetical protein